MGRTSDARNKILDAGRALIEQRGYSSLGVAEICATAGVPKGSFYYFFESKQALALAVIDDHWADQRRQWDELLRSDRDPLSRLKDLFDATEQTQRAGQLKTGHVVGCLFGNLALELSNQADEVRSRLQQIFDEQIDMIEQVVVEARDAGQAGASVDAREAARSIVAQIEGRVLLAKLLSDPAQLEALRQNSLDLLQTPAGPRGRARRPPHDQRGAHRHDHDFDGGQRRRRVKRTQYRQVSVDPPDVRKV